MTHEENEFLPTLISNFSTQNPEKGQRQCGPREATQRYRDQSGKY
jgi:hypothetical protein